MDNYKDTSIYVLVKCCEENSNISWWSVVMKTSTYLGGVLWGKHQYIYIYWWSVVKKSSVSVLVACCWGLQRVRCCFFLLLLEKHKQINLTGYSRKMTEFFWEWRQQMAYCICPDRWNRFNIYNSVRAWIRHLGQQHITLWASLGKETINLKLEAGLHINACFHLLFMVQREFSIVIATTCD